MIVRLALFFAALLLAVPAGAAGRRAPTGSFVDLPRVASKALGAPMHVTVWLPPGHGRGKARWPVIYMHDGQNLFFPAKAGYGKVWAADKAMLQLIGEGETRGAIIVGIWHPQDRARTYFPQALYAALPPPQRQTADAFLQGPVQSDAYLRFITTELKPMIDRRYRTLPDRAHTMVAGSSMGGLISLYAIARYPDVFGSAACVSTHWPLAAPDQVGPMQATILGAWDRFLRDDLGPPQGRRIWFDHGDQTLDSFYGPWQVEIDRRMVANGWQPQRDFETKTYVGAGHEENAWAERLPEIFAWLLAEPPE